MKILILNGPDLDKLGTRQPEIYGKKTLKEVEKEVESYCKKHNAEPVFFQSNSEDELIQKIKNFKGDALIINAGALTHYSYLLADALKDKNCYKIELHISNIFAREDFRRKSVLSEFCDAFICGFGTDGYVMAAQAAIEKLK